MSARRAFTLIELLVVIAIIAILAAILFPVFTRAKAAAKKTESLNQFKQWGVGIAIYMSDYHDQLPDRRDLKDELGYRPWTDWPLSDPRAGWAAETFHGYLGSHELAFFRPTHAAFGDEIRVNQEIDDGDIANFWMWRFDRMEDPVPLDNLWGKSPEQAVADLQQANNPFIGVPEGVSDVEMAAEPYFPRTSAAPEHLRGKSVHFGGRNRLFLDSHVKFLRDARTD